MNLGVPGWERLRHGGLLLDGTRLAALAREAPAPLDESVERQLRQRAGAILDGDGERDGGAASSFVAFVLEEVCGLDPSTGTWARGNRVAPSWGRRAVTGETVKPRHLWTGENGGRLPVFLDEGRRLGVGRGRRVVSRVLGWLRAGGDHLALVTNGRQWRLVFAGLDYEAWCEWDIDLWFEEGGLSPQVSALRTLLSAGLWTPPAEDAAPPLLQAIRDTRKGQAELSEVLGERVREAVEILIRGHGEALSALVEGPGEDLAAYQEYLADVAGVSLDEVPLGDEDSPAAPTPQDIYRAACRVAMRLVVILFAESRELLPRDNALYHASYGLNGLLEGLEREAARGGALASSFAAWPRVLALFRLVREGSHHPDLPVTAYGGDLFSPGASDATDGLGQALFVFENACFAGEALPDRDVHEMLKLLTRTTIRIRQGRGGTRAAVPVDFSDLSSEYIGILYEGLLDYELKTAPPGDPVIFLAVGDQPALPLSRLEAMEDRALKALFERFKDSSSSADDVPEGEEGGDASSEPPDPGGEEGGDPGGPADGDLFGEPVEGAADEARDPDPEDAAPDTHPAGSDERQRSRTRAEVWARRATEVAGLVKKPRGRDAPERRLELESRVGAKARQLVARVVLPGEWYLVRWGGTRKGSGSFYTRPGLAVPTVQRTLRPLAFDPPASTDGTLDRDAPPANWSPKRPEEILALTVCDPACGSGTFPIAALRFLTDSLYASLQHHGRIEPDGERSLVRLLGLRGEGDDGEGARLDEPRPQDGEGREAGADSRLGDELIPCPPDDDRFEPRLKAVLRRHVVERCIYAVDLDPLAVELCRLSLWIETMDRTLPFGFLDHKVKCGNALVGAWFDQFRHYPVMAWKNREGGDRNHTNGVHFEKEARTKAIKAFVKDRLTPDLRLFLQGRDLFQEDLLEESVTVHDDALAVLAEMHALPVQDAAERARIYRERLLGSPAWRSLKRAMDLWCACWFWPADEVEYAPRSPHLRRAALPKPGPWPSESRPRCASSIGSSSSRTCSAKRLGLRRDPWQSAVGHREARLQGVLLEPRPALPLLRQAGGVGEAAGLLRRRPGGARLARLRRPLPRPVELHELRREPVRRPRGERQEPGSLHRRAGQREPRPPRSLAAGPRGLRRLRRSGAPVSPSGVGGPQPLQALPRSRPRAVEAGRPAGLRRSLGPLLGPRHGRAPPPAHGTLPVGVAVRDREPRQGLSNRQPLQVQPGHRREGRFHPSDPHRLHAPQSGRLGARRRIRHPLHPHAGRAVQPPKPSHPRDPIPARLGDPREDLRQRRTSWRRRPGRMGYPLRDRVPHDERLAPLPAAPAVGGEGLPSRRVQPLAARRLAPHRGALASTRCRSDQPRARGDRHGDRAGGLAVRHHRRSRTPRGRGTVRARPPAEARRRGPYRLAPALRPAPLRPPSHPPGEHSARRDPLPRRRFVDSGERYSRRCLAPLSGNHDSALCSECTRLDKRNRTPGEVGLRRPREPPVESAVPDGFIGCSRRPPERHDPSSENRLSRRFERQRRPILHGRIAPGLSLRQFRARSVSGQRSG